MGRYTARIAAKRADELRLAAIGVFPIVIDYSYLFTDYEQVMDEERIEQEILDSFGGYHAMVEYVEAETAGKIGMTVAEAIAYLRALSDPRE